MSLLSQKADDLFNRIEKNSNYGINLDSLSDGNTIHHNDFIRNNLAGNSQGFDDGTDNVFYDSDVNEGNYWSNYEGSEGYIIEGDAYSVDFYPLNEGGTIPDIPEYSHSIVFLSLMIAGFVVIFFLFKRNRN